MKVLYFGDPIGCGNDNFEKEAKYVKKWLKDFIFEKEKFQFIATMDSCKIADEQCDIFIFDFGGIGLGCGDLVSSLSRHILKQIEERPSTLFVAWTSFTNDYLRDECSKELGDYPNLISRDYENEPVINAIKKWINQGDIK
jgi:hypothetical protein